MAEFFVADAVFDLNSECHAVHSALNADAAATSRTSGGSLFLLSLAID